MKVNNFFILCGFLYLFSDFFLLQASFEAATKVSESFPHPDSPGVSKVSPLKELPPKKIESDEKPCPVQALQF